MIMGIFNDSYNVANGVVRMKQMNDKKKEQEKAKQQAQQSGGDDQKPKGIFF
jgi:hypothetical protein